MSAAFLDYDRDGWLDLFAGNYLSWRADASAPCPTPSGRPDYCSPNTFQPQQSRLYRNNRNGTFTDASATAGIAHDFGPALGVSTADFNRDGWIDLYVANDGQPNLLWMNQQNGTFKNLGLLSGTALSAHGKAKAGMGVDAGDADNDGDEDLFVTNLTGEGNDLYVNDGAGYFEEQSARSGLGAPSRGFTGFGTALVRRGQRRLAGHHHRERRGADHRGAAPRQRPVSAAPAQAPVPQPRQRPVRGRLGAGRAPPSSCRRWAGARRSATWTTTATWTCWWRTTTARRGCSSTRSAAATTGSACGWSAPDATCWARASAWCARTARRCGAGRGRTAATRRPTIRGSSWAWAPPRAVARIRVIWPGGATEEWSPPEVDRYTTLREGEAR